MKGESRSRSVRTETSVIHRRPLVSLRLILAITAVVGVSIGLFVYVGQSPPVELPPLPDLRAASPAVQQLIGDAYADVIRHPDNGRLWGQLGMVYLGHQFEREAVVCFESAARRDTSEPRWPYFAGLSLSSTDADAAAERFRQVLRLSPRTSTAHVRLAEILLARHAYSEAEEHFDAGISRDRRDARAHLGKARCRLLQGDLTSARNEAREAEKINSEVREVQEFIATVERRLGDIPAAQSALENASRLRDRNWDWNDPWAAEVISLRRDARWSLRQADELAASSRLTEAIHELRGAILADDRDPELYSTLAQYLVRAQRVAETKTLLEAGRKRHPRSAEIFFQSGVSAFLTNDFSRAEEFFRESLEMRADYPLAHYNLGHVHLRQNRIDDALRDFQEAVRVRPEYADAHANIGKILMTREQFTEARAYLERAVALAPENAWARQLLEQIRQR